MSDAVLLEIHDAVATIRLNREDNRNAMTAEVLDVFEERVREVRARNEIRAVVIAGTGKHFCAGADFRTSGELMQRSGLDGLAGRRESTRRIYGAFLSVLDIDVPVIAAVNGHAIGGGLGLALVCDVRVVSETAKVGANFVRLGLHPGMGISYLLPRLVGIERAAELLFTGRLLTGKEAHQVGLAAHVEPADRVLEKATEIARAAATAAPYAVRLTKRTFYDLLNLDVASAAEREAFAQSLTAQMDDAREGIAALLEKREPVFRGK